MQDADYFKCSGCGYEFLSASKNPKCPKCGNTRLEKADMGKVVGLDD